MDPRPRKTRRAWNEPGHAHFLTYSCFRRLPLLTRLSVEYPSRRVFRFWQPGGGFDPNAFREKTVPAVIDYIHANPVRRGLVAQPTDWEWSSARFWETWSNVPLRMDDHALRVEDPAAQGQAADHGDLLRSFGTPSFKLPS